MVDTFRLLCDTGLLVLIWMVQLIAYPSFLYFSKENLFKWHTSYTKRIAVLVIPLMFGQLITVSLQVINQQGYYEIASIVLVLLAWITTFLQFVPLHNNINTKKNVDQSLKELIHKNWIRTVIWSFVFLLSFYNQFIL